MRSFISTSTLQAWGPSAINTHTLSTLPNLHSPSLWRITWNPPGERETVGLEPTLTGLFKYVGVTVGQKGGCLAQLGAAAASHEASPYLLVATAGANGGDSGGLRRRGPKLRLGFYRPCAQSVSTAIGRETPGKGLFSGEL